MTLYESNYLKLGRLVSQFPREKVVWTSSAPRDCDLHVEVLRHEPYTTTMRMTYWFVEPDAQPIADPDLTLRVYHDARLAEAITARVAHRHEVLQNLDPAHAAELGRRWRINMMLNKWLDYLLDVGHTFR